MSDFDKEAEREKLRKQFERDKEDREAAQRMSELLLRGATMTNRHCENCGDPIFRYEETEFCPSCSTGDTESVQTDGHPSVDDREPPSSTSPTVDDSENGGIGMIEGSVNPPSTGTTDAEYELRRTIEEFARRARECDDPRRARDHLDVANVAAKCFERIAK